MTFICDRGSLALLPGSLLLKELVAGSGDHGNEGHEFPEVTFAIPVEVQSFHDFVHSFLLPDFLREMREGTQPVFKRNLGP